MKLNKQEIFKALLIILLLVLILDIFYFYFRDSEVNFEEAYTQVGNNIYEKPHKVNTKYDDVMFYKPRGYTLRGDLGLFIENIYCTIQIVPGELDVEKIGEAYSINENSEVVFQTGDVSVKDKYVQMIVWDIGDMYEVLLVNDENNAVVADTKKNYAVECIEDMSIILNSIIIE